MARASVIAGALGLAVAMTTSPPAHSTPPELTPMEIQAIQQREFEADKPTVFASVMDVLQDLGFTIASADLNTGFITAASPVTNTEWNLWWGRSTGNTRLTVFIESLANGRTRARLNFVSTRNRLGWSYTMEHREKAIFDPQPYAKVFEKISEALFVRKATNSPAGPPASAAPH